MLYTKERQAAGSEKRKEQLPPGEVCDPSQGDTWNERFLLGYPPPPRSQVKVEPTLKCTDQSWEQPWTVSKSAGPDPTWEWLQQTTVWEIGSSTAGALNPAPRSSKTCIDRNQGRRRLCLQASALSIYFQNTFHRKNINPCLGTIYIFRGKAKWCKGLHLNCLTARLLALW